MDTAPSTTTTIQYQNIPTQEIPSSIPGAPGFPPLSTNPTLSEAFPDTRIHSDRSNTKGPSFSGPVHIQSPRLIPQDIKTARSSVENGLGQLISLQRRRFYTDEIGFGEQLRVEMTNVLTDLRALRHQVSDIIREAEAHRWRKWLAGGVVASFIPVVRAIWRRPRYDIESSNDTEYAFWKSNSLIRRILNSVHGFGGLATFTFFVFSVVYVFRNEVVLRVAKTVSKRLKRLSAKIERDEEALTEADLKLLQGWRWRVLL